MAAHAYFARVAGVAPQDIPTIVPAHPVIARWQRAAELTVDVHGPHDGLTDGLAPPPEGREPPAGSLPAGGHLGGHSSAIRSGRSGRTDVVAPAASIRSHAAGGFAFDAGGDSDARSRRRPPSGAVPEFRTAPPAAPLQVVESNHPLAGNSGPVQSSGHAKAAPADSLATARQQSLRPEPGTSRASQIGAGAGPGRGDPGIGSTETNSPRSAPGGKVVPEAVPASRQTGAPGRPPATAEQSSRVAIDPGRPGTSGAPVPLGAAPPAAPLGKPSLRIGAIHVQLQPVSAPPRSARGAPTPAPLARAYLSAFGLRQG